VIGDEATALSFRTLAKLSLAIRNSPATDELKHFQVAGGKHLAAGDAQGLGAGV
jgi:hypothetical protein